MKDRNLAKWKDANGARKQRRFDSPGDARAYESAMKSRVEGERKARAAARKHSSEKPNTHGAPIAIDTQQRETKTQRDTQTDPRRGGGFLTDDETEQSIRYCAEQYAAALTESLSQGCSQADAEKIARDAYRLALPTLTPNAARAFVACLVQGVQMAVYAAKDVTPLLYAAQLCMGNSAKQAMRG